MKKQQITKKEQVSQNEMERNKKVNEAIDYILSDKNTLYGNELPGDNLTSFKDIESKLYQLYRKVSILMRKSSDNEVLSDLYDLEKVIENITFKHNKIHTMITEIIYDQGGFIGNRGGMFNDEEKLFLIGQLLDIHCTFLYKKQIG